MDFLGDLHIVLHRFDPEGGEPRVRFPGHKAGAKGVRGATDGRRGIENFRGALLVLELGGRIAAQTSGKIRFAEMHRIFFREGECAPRILSGDDHFGGHQLQAMGLASRDGAHDEVMVRSVADQLGVFRGEQDFVPRGYGNHGLFGDLHRSRQFFPVGSRCQPRRLNRAVVAPVPSSARLGRGRKAPGPALPRGATGCRRQDHPRPAPARAADPMVR